MPPSQSVGIQESMARATPLLRLLLEERRAANGGDVAFVDGASGATRSWADIGAATETWTDRADAIGQGGRVGLVCSDPLEMATSFLAALAAGVCVAPLDPRAAASELSGQAATLGLHAVVADREAAPAVAHLTTIGRWATGPSGPALAAAAKKPASATEPSRDAAVILASSGTTGTPKIVPLTEAHLVHTAANVAAEHRLTAADRGYSPLPLFHINGLVVGVLSTVLTGGSLVVDRRFSAAQFWARADAHRATWLNLVPAIITVLSEQPVPEGGLSDRIGFVRSASAPLPRAARERFEARCGIGVLETYGMTEAASQIAANPREPGARRPGSVGRPVGLDLRIVDRTGRPLAAGQVGQVEIRGVNVVAEYWAPVGATPVVRPATNADGWLATGDLGKLDADGFVYLVGRVDDVINRGGEKVFPREVEEILLQDPEVGAAAVVGRPHATVGEEPVAFVLAASGTDEEALLGRLETRCEQELSRFKRPAEIVVADSLPSGPTGKIRHGELRRAVADAAAAGSGGERTG